jgi:phosphoglycerol transferase
MEARRIAALATQLRRNPLLVAVPAIFVALLLRNGGLYPSVFADEWAYSTASRLLPFSHSPFPNYAYLAMFSLTNSCGDGFLACARILNAAAFVAASPFIYLTARRVCTRGVATLVTVLTLAGPINTYTAYFMPEALYFLSFWVFAWFILGLDSSSDWRMWIITGALLGAAALVKPHALFLVPATLLYLMYMGGAQRPKRVRSAVWNGVLVVVAALLVKFAGGYLLAGSAGLTLFGSTYMSQAISVLSDSDQSRQWLTVSAQSVVGHLLAICLMFGLPVALSAAGLVRGLRSSDRFEAEERTSAFALLILADLVVVVALYTSVSATGPVDYATRLHMRYYDFALPLLVMVAGAQLDETRTRDGRRWYALVALPIGLAIAYAVITRLGPYTPILVDSPELRGFTAYSRPFIVLGCLSLGTLVLWAFGSRWGPRLFVYAFLPLALVVTSVAGSIELRGHLVPDGVDRAGMFVKHYLPEDELSHVLVVGSEPADLFRAVFYLDDPQAGLLVIPEGSNFDLSTLPEGKDWALIIGDHAWTGGTFSESPSPGFALVRRDNPAANAPFRTDAGPGFISRMQGLFPGTGQPG